MDRKDLSGFQLYWNNPWYNHGKGKIQIWNKGETGHILYDLEGLMTTTGCPLLLEVLIPEVRRILKSGCQDAAAPDAAGYTRELCEAARAAEVAARVRYISRQAPYSDAKAGAISGVYAGAYTLAGTPFSGIGYRHPDADALVRAMREKIMESEASLVGIKQFFGFLFSPAAMAAVPN